MRFEWTTENEAWSICKVGYGTAVHDCFVLEISSKDWHRFVCSKKNAKQKIPKKKQLTSISLPKPLWYWWKFVFLPKLFSVLMIYFGRIRTVGRWNYDYADDNVHDKVGCCSKVDIWLAVAEHLPLVVDPIRRNTVAPCLQCRCHRVSSLWTCSKRDCDV